MILGFGDESSHGNAVVFGIAGVPAQGAYRAELVLAELKRRARVPVWAPFHCREAFHPDARRKSPWSALTDEAVFSFASTLVLATKKYGVRYFVGFIDRDLVPASLDLGTPVEGGKRIGMNLESNKELSVLAYWSAAARSHHVFPGQELRIVVDPDRTQIRFLGEGRGQVSRKLGLFLDLGSSSEPPFHELEVPVGPKPPLLQLADALSYFAAHAVSKTPCRSKRIFQHTFKAARADVTRLAGPWGTSEVAWQTKANGQ